jgi:hypothetical protein
MHAQGKALTAQLPASVTVVVDPNSVIYDTTLTTSVCRTCVGPERLSKRPFATSVVTTDAYKERTVLGCRGNNTGSVIGCQYFIHGCYFEQCRTVCDVISLGVVGIQFDRKVRLLKEAD